MSKKKFTSKALERRKIQARNWLAVHAFQRSGAGSHGDKKKSQSKKACRGSVNVPS
jgi:hypothetical protein